MQSKCRKMMNEGYKIGGGKELLAIIKKTKLLWFNFNLVNKGCLC